MAVRFAALHEAARGQVCHHPLTRLEAIQAAVPWRRVVVDLGIRCEDVDALETVSLAGLVVVEVVGWRNLHAAAAEFGIDHGICDDGDASVAER